MPRSRRGALVSPGRSPAARRPLEPEPGQTDRRPRRHRGRGIRRARSGRGARGAARSARCGDCGSAGKTTTKEVAAEFLRRVRLRKKASTHIGRSCPRVSRGQVRSSSRRIAGEIRTLVGIAEPGPVDHRDAHLGFDLAEAIADEGDPRGRANGRARRQRRRRADHAARGAVRGPRRTFGADARPTSRPGQWLRGLQGTAADVRRRRRVRETLLLGPATANVMAAIGAALEFDIPLGDIASRAAKLAPPHRAVLPPGGVTTWTLVTRARPRSSDARDDRRQRAARARSRCSARCWSRPYAEALHEAWLGGGAFDSTSSPRRRLAARALADAAIRRHAAAAISMSAPR